VQPQSAMTSYRITLLPGDGIGPEITDVARQLLDAVSRRHGFELVYDEQPMGGAPSTTPCPVRSARSPVCWDCGPAWDCSPICGR